MKRRFLILFMVILWLISSKAWAYTSKDCITCHGGEGKQSILHISIKEFQGSSHGIQFTCRDCHTGVKDKGHEHVKGSGAVECGQCHERKNMHGISAKNEKRPKCYSCHGKHDILGRDKNASKIHPDRLKETCKGCHPIECGEIDYFSWLPSLQIMSHKKQDFSQAYKKDNCIGCHQGQAAHGEKRRLNDQNCHECHMKTKAHGQLMGYIHVRADAEKQPVVFTAAIVYQVFIVLLLWGGFRFLILKLSGKSGKGKK